MLDEKRIVVVGAQGMLAHDLIVRLQKTNATLELYDRDAGEACGMPVMSLDITIAADCDEVVQDAAADWVINCAAYTAVDAAEEDEALAFAVNGHGVGNLAHAVSLTEGSLCHISTDYVFGGVDGSNERRRPYTEGDMTDPCGVYGKTKAEGEQQLFSQLPDRSLLFRTSWLHGAAGNSFVSTILKHARVKEELRIVSDQFGSPTWTGWLADVIIAGIAQDAHGVFHASSKAGITWYEFTKEIVAQVGLSTRIEAQTTAELGRPAPRPAYSVFDVTKLETELGIEVLDWKEGLRQHLLEMSES
jgi:dTDP-4-dehydrorhamnose reductase